MADQDKAAASASASASAAVASATAAPSAAAPAAPDTAAAAAAASSAAAAAAPPAETASKGAGGGGGGGGKVAAAPKEATGGGGGAPAPAAPKESSLAAAMAGGAAAAGGGGGAAEPFNMGEAKARLAAAATAAQGCKKGDGPTGTGRVVVLFCVADSAGAAQSATSVSGPPPSRGRRRHGQLRRRQVPHGPGPGRTFSGSLVLRQQVVHDQLREEPWLRLSRLQCGVPSRPSRRDRGRASGPNGR